MNFSVYLQYNIYKIYDSFIRFSGLYTHTYTYTPMNEERERMKEKKKKCIILPLNHRNQIGMVQNIYCHRHVTARLSLDQGTIIYIYIYCWQVSVRYIATNVALHIPKNERAREMSPKRIADYLSCFYTVLSTDRVISFRSHGFLGSSNQKRLCSPLPLNHISISFIY